MITPIRDETTQDDAAQWREVARAFWIAGDFRSSAVEKLLAEQVASATATIRQERDEIRNALKSAHETCNSLGYLAGQMKERAESSEAHCAAMQAVVDQTKDFEHDIASCNPAHLEFWDQRRAEVERATIERDVSIIDGESFYDKEIAPVLCLLANQCAERGLGFVAAVQYAPEGVGSTVKLGATPHPTLRLAAYAVRCKGNVDLLITCLLKDGKDHGHNSVYLNLLEMPP